MRAHLRARLGDKLWTAKVEAGRISLPLIQEQIRLNSQLYNDFRERLGTIWSSGSTTRAYV